MLAYETEALATEAEAETKAFSAETEAKTKTFSLEAEARPRRLKFQSRRDLAKSLLRLETASRPRRQDRGHIPEVCCTLQSQLPTVSELVSQRKIGFS